MIPVSTDHRILLLEELDEAGRNGFLAIVKVDETEHLAAVIHLGAHIFESPSQHHVLIKNETFLFCDQLQYIAQIKSTRPVKNLPNAQKSSFAVEHTKDPTRRHIPTRTTQINHCEINSQGEANTGLEEEEGDLEARFSLTAWEMEAATTGTEDLRLV